MVNTWKKLADKKNIETKTFWTIISDFRADYAILFYTLIITIILGIPTLYLLFRQTQASEIDAGNNATEKSENNRPNITFVWEPDINLNTNQVSVGLKNEWSVALHFEWQGEYKTLIMLRSSVWDWKTIVWIYPNKAIEWWEIMFLTGTFQWNGIESKWEIFLQCKFSKPIKDEDWEIPCTTEWKNKIPIEIQPYLNMDFIINDATYGDKNCDKYKCDSISIKDLESFLTKKWAKVLWTQISWKKNDKIWAFETEAFCSEVEWKGEAVAILYYNIEKYAPNNPLIEKVANDIKTIYPHLDRVLQKTFTDLENPDGCLWKIQDVIGDCTSSKYAPATCGGDKTDYNNSYTKYQEGDHFIFTPKLVNNKDISFYILMPWSKKMTTKPN